MARKVYEEKNIANIAEKIREKTGGNTTYKTREMASGIDAVYDKGTQDEYDAFWDAYQTNGARNNYNYAFAGYGWTDETFVPKYDIVPTSVNAKYIFANCQIVDLSQALNKSGRVLDISNATATDSMFSYAYCATIPPLDISNATNTANMFNYSKAVTIEGLIVSENTVFNNNTFTGASILENLTIEGVIAKSLNISASTKLTKASITSIIDALSSTTSGLTVTLSKTAVNNAFETASGLADGSTSAEWNVLIAPKSNWIRSLV